MEEDVSSAAQTEMTPNINTEELLGSHVAAEIFSVPRYDLLFCLGGEG